MTQNNEVLIKYTGSKITDKIILPADATSKYLIVSSDSTLDLQFCTTGENTKGDIFAIFFGDKPIFANIISKIQNSNCHINVLLLSFINTDELIDVQGSIDLGKNIFNAQGHLLEKNIIIQNSGDKNGKKVKIKAVPRLDVYSNDVQASHGLSIDRINEDNLFYLTSKGLAADESQGLIVKGYIQNILEQFTILSDDDKNNIEKMILDQTI